MNMIKEKMMNSDYEDDSHIKCIIWDFDGTVTCVHTPHIDISSLKTNPLNSIIADPLIFRNVILLLYRLGYNVGIASFGYRQKIIALLNRIFMKTDAIKSDELLSTNNTNTEIDPIQEFIDKVYKDLIHSIRTPNSLDLQEWKEGYEAPLGYSKVNLLDDLRDYWSSTLDNEIFINSNCILLDDSIKNCLMAEMQGYKAKPIKHFSRHYGFEVLNIEDPKELFAKISNDHFQSLWDKFLLSSFDSPK